jgi:hypothetical protein
LRNPLGTAIRPVSCPVNGAVMAPLSNRSPLSYNRSNSGTVSGEGQEKGANKFGLDAVSGFYNFEKNEFYPIGQHVYIGRASEELWEYSPLADR